jgi:hypothetical protein
MIKKPFFILGVFAILMCACGENKKSPEATASVDPGTSAKTDNPSKSTEAVKSHITVTIKDGPLAGTYEADCREGCTSYGIAGEKVFGNQYSETGKGPQELSSVQLIVDDVNGDKQTKEFMVTVSFGDFLSDKGTNYNINTRKGKSEGSGTVDLKYGGEKGTVKIVGKSKEGPALEVLIDAGKVLTANNIGQ